MSAININTMYKIYKILNEDGKIYIGSTKQNLNNRFSSHKCQIKSGKSRCSNKNFNMDTATIELIEEMNNCQRKDVLYRERYYIETTDCVNTDLPIVSEQERKEKQKQACDKWKENNRYNIECECGAVIQNREIARHQKTKKHLNFINSK